MNLDKMSFESLVDVTYNLESLKSPAESRIDEVPRLCDVVTFSVRSRINWTSIHHEESRIIEVPSEKLESRIIEVPVVNLEQLEFI